MERDVQYIAKGHSGRESPIKTSMFIEITNPNRYDRHDIMCDVIFYNYFDSIGSKRYCAYEIVGDCMFFKFFDTNDNDIHRYTMFSRNGKKENFKAGKPIAFNVYNNQNVFKFVSKFKYPVYYNVRTDEYHIDLHDSVRPKLFDITTKSQNFYNKENDMSRSIEIDGVKLRHEFEVRNIALIDVSERCGFEASYFSNVCRSNRIRKPAAKLLEQMYNIKYEDYRPDEPEEEKSEVLEVAKETPLVITDDTKNVLRDVIYSAVYDAVKKAWSE